MKCTQRAVCAKSQDESPCVCVNRAAGQNTVAALYTHRHGPAHRSGAKSSAGQGPVL